MLNLLDKGKGRMREDSVSSLNYSILPNPPSSPPSHHAFHPDRFARTYPPSPPPTRPAYPTDPKELISAGGQEPNLLVDDILVIGDPTKSASSTPAPSCRSPTVSTVSTRPLSSAPPTRQPSTASSVNRRARSRSTRRTTATTTTTTTTYGSSSIPSFPIPPPLPYPMPISPFGPARQFSGQMRLSPEPIDERSRSLPPDDEPDPRYFPPPALSQRSRSRPRTPLRSRPQSVSGVSANQLNGLLHSRSRSDSLPSSPPPPPITPHRPPLPTLNRSPPMRTLDETNSEFDALFRNAPQAGVPEYDPASSSRGTDQSFGTLLSLSSHNRSQEER